jgi:hypothetical protein
VTSDQNIRIMIEEKDMGIKMAEKANIMKTTKIIFVHP